MRARTASIVAALLLASCGSGEPGPQRTYDDTGRLLGTAPALAPHNVLLISIDTLRADHLGCYGYARSTSPRLDALAAEGVVFEETLSASPWTTPAHVSLMTSLYPAAHGVLSYPVPGELNAEVVTLAEALRAQGWRTAGFTEGGYAKGETGLAHGFETFPSWPRDDEGFVSHELEPSRLVENVERALAWLDANAEERFFLFFHTYEPHYEYRPPEEYLTLLAPELDLGAERERLDAVVVRWNAEKILTQAEKGVLYRHHLRGDLLAAGVERPRKLFGVLARFVENEWKRSPSFAEDLAFVEALYDAEIRFTDDEVGRLLDRLVELGVADDTLVVVTSDHGEGLMDHDELQHGFHLYDELLQVPLIVRFPGGQHAGRRHARQVRSVDVAPTVLDVVGLPAPEAAQGTSLLPLLQGDRAARDGFAEGLTIEGGELGLQTLRTERWKYVRDNARGVERLFTLGEPEETEYAGEDREQLLAELRARFDRISAENAVRGARFVPREGSLTEDERRRLEALGYAGHDEE